MDCEEDQQGEDIPGREDNLCESKEAWESWYILGSIHSLECLVGESQRRHRAGKQGTIHIL